MAWLLQSPIQKFIAIPDERFKWPAIIGWSLLGLFILFTPGCAMEPYWHTDLPGYAAPVQVVRAVSAQDLSQYCGMPRAADSACTRRWPGVCRIYLGPQAGACELAHEMCHCQGKNHKVTFGFVQDCCYPS